MRLLKKKWTGYILLAVFVISLALITKWRQDIFVYFMRTENLSTRENKPTGWCRKCINTKLYETMVYPKRIRKTEVDAILLLMSSHRKDAPARRHAIRNTWGNTNIYVPTKIQRVFVLGTCRNCSLISVYKEAIQHNDIVMFSFVDSYHNFSMKTLAALEWAVKYYKTKLFIKSDDDIVANVSRLLQVFEYHAKQNIDSFNFSEKVIVGNCKSNVAPERNPTRPYYMSKEDFVPNRYPRFCFGTTYIINNQATNAILLQTSTTPLVPAEDISVGLLAQSSGDIKLIDVDNWRIWFSKFLSRKDYNKYHTIHQLTAEEITFVWNTFYSPACRELKFWEFWEKFISKKCKNAWKSNRIPSEGCVKLLEFKNNFVSPECSEIMKMSSSSRI